MSRWETMCLSNSMFTGLIEATGRVETLDANGNGRRVRIATALAAELRPGDSVATSGVCLTAIATDSTGFSADLSPETLRVTSFSSIEIGRVLNLERPLRAGDRLGGHFVLGHVDAVGRVTAVRPEGDSFWLEIDAPDQLKPLLIHKGSVAIDGVSLTIASLNGGRLGVQLIPYTWEHTSLKYLKIGDAVNLEGDVLGKYVLRSLETAPGQRTNL
jgi:riboflavin synthase